MKTLITPALLAGLLAALIFTLVQAFVVTPLILEAETYEKAAEIAPVAHEHVAASTEVHHHDEGHHHDEEAWEPEDGWQRTLSTTSANLLMGTGYGLMLVALYSFRAPKNNLSGLVWGMAGYATVFVFPSMGLHPELPGTAAAALGSRQEWWLGTALATAIGLALCIYPRAWFFKVIGVLLIGLPHFIGAPQPAVETALAPEELQHRFVLASVFTNAIFWLALGWLSALFFRRFNQSTPTADAEVAPV